MSGVQREHGERGQILIMTALAMTAMLGVAALAIDTAFMYDKRNHLFAAADAAAKAAAIERWRSGSADLQRFAYHELAVQGIDPATLTTKIVRACDEAGATCSPVFTPSWHTYVEVIISQQTNTFFGRILGWTSLTPAARAVAGASVSTNCVVIFDHMEFTNSCTGCNVHSEGCSIVIGEPSGPTSRAGHTISADLYNDSNIYALSIGVVHNGATGCSVGCSAGGAGTFSWGVPPPSDPLASLPAPADPAPFVCGAAHMPYSFTAAATISPSDYDKYYCGFDLSGTSAGTILTFNPGTYYINGPVTDSPPNNTIGLHTLSLNPSDGVLLYFGPASSVVFDESNQVNISMTAQNSGTYSGILMFQDRTAPVQNEVVFGKNNTTMDFNGALYFKNAILEMKNENSNLLTNPCSLIVAWAVEVDKPNFRFNNQCLDFVGSPLLAASLAE